MPQEILTRQPDEPEMSKEEAKAKIFVDGKTTGKQGMSEDHFEFLWGEYEKQNEATKKYQESGMDIYPREGCVMKTWVVAAEKKPPGSDVNPNNPLGIVPRRGQKAFINLCSHESIDPPSEVTEVPEHLRKEGHVDDGSPKLRMPLSCGPLRQCMDNEDQLCLVIDIAFNPETLSKFKDREYRSMVAQFAMHNVQTKFSLELKQEVKFPKMRYKPGTNENGKPVSQRIRRPPPAKKVVELDKQDPLQEISRENKASRRAAYQELQQTPQYQYMQQVAKQQGQALPSLPPATTQTGANAAAAQAVPKGVTCPHHLLLAVTDAGTEPWLPPPAPAPGLPPGRPRALQLRIELPGVVKGAELELELSTIDMALTSKSKHIKKHNYRMEFDFPFSVDAEEIRVQLFKKTSVLVLVLTTTGPLPVPEPLVLDDDEDDEKECKEEDKDWRAALPLSNKLIFRLCA